MSKKLLFLIVLCLGSFETASADPPRQAGPIPHKAALVTHRNFVSLFYSVGSVNGHDNMRISSDGAFQIEPASWRHSKTASVTNKLSKAQFQRLLALINAADFPALKPSYRDPHLRDGGDANVGLTLSGPQGKQILFGVGTYGSVAPPGLASLEGFLYSIDFHTMPRWVYYHGRSTSR